MKWPATEVDLGVAVVSHLTSRGFEVYQEVELPHVGRCADIVARGTGEVWVVELKLHFGLDVIAQGQFWIGQAHRVFVAVPNSPTAHGRKSDGWLLGEQLLRQLGVGMLTAVAADSVSQRVEAKLCHSPSGGMWDGIHERCRDYAQAGNSDGKRYTPFTATCDELRAVVTDEPGITLKKALGRIKHHYRSGASAYGSLLHWAKKGTIRGVVTRYDGRRYRLYPADAAPEVTPQELVREALGIEREGW